MPKYSATIISYIAVQSTSLLLILLLIFLLLKSNSHFAKWTLFQLFISAFCNGFSALPPIIMYGDELMDRAFESPVCIITNRIANYTKYPLEFFSLAILFYLWHVLVTRRLDIEKKCFWYVSGVIWLHTTVYNIYEISNSSKLKNWNVRVSMLNCKSNLTAVSFYGYVIPTTMMAFITIVMSCHSSVILYKRWKNFNCITNRATAIRLGHAVRLNTLCVTTLVILLFTLIPRIIYYYNDNSYDNNAPLLLFSSFVISTVGIMLFLIFGTNTKAALFLPFCYYVPPDERLTQESTCIL